jgi:hypothetical protein
VFVELAEVAAKGRRALVKESAVGAEQGVLVTGLLMGVSNLIIKKRN